MTNDNDFASYAIDACSVQFTPEENITMVERGPFDELGITEGQQDEFLTYDEVFSLLESYATLPREGKNSVLSLQARFANTIFETAISKTSQEGYTTAEWLYVFLQERFCGPGDGDIWIRNGKVVVEIGSRGGHKDFTDDKYHMDWQDRAIHYRLAAKQIDPSIPIDDLDKLGVVFTPEITHQNQFFIKQESGFKIYNPFDSKGIHRLSIDHYQYRLCETSVSGEWFERDALTIVSVTEDVPRFDGVDWRPTEKREMYALLNRPALPGEYFGDGADKWSLYARSHEIWAPIPVDLTPPDDLPFWLGFDNSLHVYNPDNNR